MRFCRCIWFDSNWGTVQYTKISPAMRKWAGSFVAGKGSCYEPFRLTSCERRNDHFSIFPPPQDFGGHHLSSRLEISNIKSCTYLKTWQWKLGMLRCYLCCITWRKKTSANNNIYISFPCSRSPGQHLTRRLRNPTPPLQWCPKTVRRSRSWQSAWPLFPYKIDINISPW